MYYIKYYIKMNKEQIKNIIKEKYKEVTFENISILLSYNLVSKQTLEKFVNYDIIKNYGHYILGNFGSDYYNNLKNKIIDEYISNITEKNELDKIITLEILQNNKNSIIEKFGIDYYNKKLLVYI